MQDIDAALGVIGWTPFVLGVAAAFFQPTSWSAFAKAIHALAWVLLGWGLVVAHVEVAQFAASARASTDQELLDLYASDGAARAFAVLFGWWLPLAGVVSGVALRVLSRRLGRRQDRTVASITRSDASRRG